MDLEKLLEPFQPGDIEWRLQSAGKGNAGIWAKVLAYITNRAIMQRLDEVCGAANWRNEFAPAPCGGVMCGISIRVQHPAVVGDTNIHVPEPEWVTKWDGAENTDIEAVKGGLSGAMKRAAVQWGIGRYLYDLEEGWAKIGQSGAHYGKLKKEDGGDSFRWDPPTLPAWATPTGTPAPARSQSGPPETNGQARQPWDRPIPFGRPESKGKKLGDLTPHQLSGALDWCNAEPERAQKFADLVKDLEATIARNTGTGEALWTA